MPVIGSTTSCDTQTTTTVDESYKHIIREKMIVEDGAKVIIYDGAALKITDGTLNKSMTLKAGSVGEYI
jgi:hypothetical protein